MVCFCAICGLKKCTQKAEEAISKVIQKMAKRTSQRTAKGSLKLLPADITAENAPFRRSKRGRFDNFEEFWNWLLCFEIAVDVDFSDTSGFGFLTETHLGKTSDVIECVMSGGPHYEKSAISSWNFAFAVLYCGVFILTNRKGEKTELKTIWTENYILHKKATSTKLPHLVNKAFNQWKVVLCRVAFSIHGAFLLCISIGALW